MASGPSRAVLSLLIVAAALAAAPPVHAFEIFGIHLWGPREEEEEDGFEIIDPLPYTVTTNVRGGEEDGGLEGQVRAASALWSERDTPASGVGGLLSKARGDYRRLLAAAYAAGYYGPVISIRAAGQEVATMTLSTALPEPVPITIDVVAGPRFRFGATRIVNAPPWDPREDADTPESIGFTTGETARAGVVNQASALAIERWRQLSYAKAREAGREVVAVHPTDRLDVTLTMEPGRSATYGPTRVSGARRTDPGFIAYMADLPEGHPFDPDDIDAAQRRLTSLQIFRSLRFEEAETIAPDGSLPITVRVEERRRRTIGVGATLSTLDGLGVSAFWVNRNLFGHAEQLRFDASVDGLGSSLDPDDYDYRLGVSFTRPGVFNPNTNFTTSLFGQRVDYDTYRERSLTALAGFSRLFGENLTGSLFGKISRARYEDDFGVRHFTIFGLVGSAQYDRRDDPLDATRGYYLAATADPFYEAEFGNPAAQTTFEGRVYKGFGEERRLVLAGRAKVGNFFGPDAAESPPDMLFFAGGGGSVRGYGYRSIGVDTVDSPDAEEPEDIVIGGAGLVEASAEVRYRFGERFGAVGFFDAGLVTEDYDFGGESTFKTGTGLGVRYYTAVGVLRFDVATPLQPDEDDSAVALYIGIGQAF